jgi:hypothetical protein
LNTSYILVRLKEQIMYGVIALGIATLASVTLVHQVQAELSLTIRNDVAGNASFPTLYGYMYEDINHCGDGGMSFVTEL